MVRLWLRLDHIIIDGAPRVNPLWVSCYQDEDMAAWLHLGHVAWPSWSLKSQVCFDTNGESSKVGKIKKLAVMAHPNKLGRQVLQRYASFVAVRWSRRLEKWWITIKSTVVTNKSRVLNVSSRSSKCRPSSWRRAQCSSQRKWLDGWVTMEEQQMPWIPPKNRLKGNIWHLLFFHGRVTWQEWCLVMWG